MRYSKELFPDTLYKLEIIDKQNKRFSGEQIEKENLMVTKHEEQFISICAGSNSGKAILLVSIRNKEDSRNELRNVGSLDELSDVIEKELGMTLLYQSQPV